MAQRFLYETIEVLEQTGFLQDMPVFIEKGLSSRIALRDYQKRAFQYFVTYYENLRKNKQVHTLFHMATGSGKTIIMAGLMLYLYRKGYRNFLFFVDQTNIIEKTKENFLNPASNKYLFADNLEINGEQIPIREVDNFAAYDESAINVCFTTTQKLHLDLCFPREDTITLEDFEDNRIVLISDESHHVNTRTKRGPRDEVDRTWEDSVMRIFEASKDNILLEFTATCDKKDPAVRQKYLDKIIFDYSLPIFRESGYTKDFQNFRSNFDPWNRTLAALIMSEYRRSLFAECGQDIKPVVLLKSRTIAESEAFYGLFFENLQSLTPEDITSMDSSENELLSKALRYFREKDETLQSLVHALQLGFAEDKSIIMNGKTDNTREKQLAVNSLEDPSNPYRIIFTVDMLNEGWDVLNLFDIVRLYETRQSGRGKISSYTIKEAQLIGRGARYCPFVAEPGQERYKRKYDHDLDHDNRILETLLFHSIDDSRYIEEIKRALKAIGLLPDNVVEVEYRLKEEFKQTWFFKYGLVFTNSRIEKSRDNVTQIETHIRTMEHNVEVATRKSGLVSLFDDENVEVLTAKYTTRIKLKEIPLNILYGAMERFDALSFETLKSRYPQLKSKSEFLTSSDYVGDNTLVVRTDVEDLTAKHLFDAVTKAMGTIANHVGSIPKEYKGTKEFTAKPVRDVIKNTRIAVMNPSSDGKGIPQSVVVRELAVNLRDEEWFVYEEHYGNRLEKAFVKYFQSLISDLKEKYEEIYLVRNEGLRDLRLYDFDEGRCFEPDFLLYLRRKDNNIYLQEQIFIESKGEHLVREDKWKEDFLLRIEEEGIPIKIYADDHKYRIYGLPFFNDTQKATFENTLRKIVE